MTIVQSVSLPSDWNARDFPLRARASEWVIQVPGPKFSKVRAKTILSYLRVGNFRVTACAAAGITDRTLRNWAKYAEDGRQPYKRFFEDMEVAEAQAEAGLVTLVLASARGAGKPHQDWRAAMRILESRGPKRWAPTVRQELTGRDGEPLPGAQPTPAQAAVLIRQKFGEHAQRRDGGLNFGEKFDLGPKPEEPG